MAKVFIILEDSPEGVLIVVKSDPPLVGEMSDAQHAGMVMISALTAAGEIKEPFGGITI